MYICLIYSKEYWEKRLDHILYVDIEKNLYKGFGWKCWLFQDFHYLWEDIPSKNKVIVLALINSQVILLRNSGNNAVKMFY